MANQDYDALAREAGAVNSDPQTQPQPLPQQAPAGQTPGGQPVDYDALAAQSGAVAMPPETGTGAGTDKAKPSFASQAGQVVSDTLQGLGEGALQTVHGVGEGIRGGLNAWSNTMGAQEYGMGNLGNKIIPPEGQSSLAAVATPENTTQKIASGAETLLEMMAGEGILKGLSLAERLAMGAKIAKMAEDYPILGKILTQGMASLTTHAVNALPAGAAVAGTQIVKGEPVGKSLAEGAGTVAGGAVLGAAGDVASHVFNPETGLLARARQGEQIAQAPARAALEEAASNPSKTTGIRELLNPEIQKAANSSDRIYKQVERVTGIDLKTTQQKLINTEQQIDELTATEVDKIKEAHLEKSRTELMDEIDEAKQALVSKGLNPNLIDQADALYKKESALKDVQKAVFGNEGLIQGDMKYGKKESINVEAAIKNLQKLTAKTKYGPNGRLAQAIGEPAEKALMQKLYDAHELGQKAIPTQEVWKIIKRSAVRGAVTGGAGALVGGAAYESYKALHKE